MSVAFNTIVDNIRTNTSHIEADSSRAVQTVQRGAKKIMVMGIQLSTATVAELTPVRVSSESAGDGYFGVGSPLAESIRAAKKANRNTEMWACGIVANAAGTAGVRTITVTVTTALVGTIHLYIAGRYVPVAIPAGTAQNTVASLINTAIQAHPDYTRMPFTSGVATNVVTLTQRWKGVDVADVRHNYNDGEQLPGGVSLAHAISVAGATNPVVTGILDAFGDERYTHIVMPWNDTTNLGLLAAELLTRFGGMSMKDGVAFGAVNGTSGTATTLGNANNSPLVCIMGANESPVPGWIWAADIAATVAGQTSPSRPFQTLPLKSAKAAARALRWDQPTRNTMYTDGIAGHLADNAGQVTIERLITTYQTNAQSVPDVAYLDVNTVLTYMAIRDDLLASVSLAFPRSLLGDDGAPLPDGQPIVTPNLMKGHVAGRYDLWVAEGWVDGSAKQQFVDEMVVIRDPSDVTRLQGQFGPNFMNQFLGLSASIQFIL